MNWHAGGKNVCVSENSRKRESRIFWTEAPGKGEERGYQKIAIYGMANMGKHMYHALKSSSIEICYGMDQSLSGQYEAMMVKKPDEMVEPVDAMIVTAIMEYEHIKEQLEKKLTFPIVSLEEIFYETVVE